MGGTERDRILRKIEYSALPSQRAFHQSAARMKGFSVPIGSKLVIPPCIRSISVQPMRYELHIFNGLFAFGYGAHFGLGLFVPA